ncbi:hypothetical protein CsSME_00019636 [Camellia sinensis var. sinensis]
MSKAQLVFIPSPGIGHLVSTVEMAKLLVGRDDRLSITVLVMKFPFDNKGTSYTQSLSSDRIRFLDLLHDTPSTADLNSKTPGSFLFDYIESHKPRVRDVVSEIVSKSESESTPRLAGFVIDMFCTPMIDVANEFGVPTYVFFTSSAAFLGLMFHIDTLQQDVTELEDSDAELNVPAYANPVPAKFLPSVLFDKEGGVHVPQYRQALQRNQRYYSQHIHRARIPCSQVSPRRPYKPTNVSCGTRTQSQRRQPKRGPKQPIRSGHHEVVGRPGSVVGGVPLLREHGKLRWGPGQGDSACS